MRIIVSLSQKIIFETGVKQTEFRYHFHSSLTLGSSGCSPEKELTERGFPEPWAKTTHPRPPCHPAPGPAPRPSSSTKAGRQVLHPAHRASRVSSLSLVGAGQSRREVLIGRPGRCRWRVSACDWPVAGGWRGQGSVMEAAGTGTRTAARRQERRMRAPTTLEKQRDQRPAGG